MTLQPFHALSSSQRRTFAACFFGWTLDAFDFFILTWCLDSVAATFHVSQVTVTDSLFWTLCMRPVGALLFGLLAERFGRKRVLILNIACFTVFELSSAFAPTFAVFLVTRALFGIGMGGEWGVGAALAFESLPAKGRGFFSGLLQEGYAAGNLLAGALYGITYAFIFPHIHGAAYLTNWRALFVLGTLPSLGVIWLLVGCKESPAWLASRNLIQEKAADAVPVFRQVLRYLPNFLLLTLMMTAFMSFSHGTQDLYPTFVGEYGGRVWCDLWRHLLWEHLREAGAAESDRCGSAAGDTDDSALGVESYGGVAGLRRLPDAVHGAGRVGCDSCAPE